MDRRRPCVAIGERHNAFDAQQVLAALARQPAQRQGKIQPRHRPAQHQHHGTNAMRVDRGGHEAWPRSHGLDATEQQRRGRHCRGIVDAGRRVQRLEPLQQQGRWRGKVGLGEQQPVGAGGLRGGLRETVQRRCTGHRIDGGNHGVHLQRPLEERIGRQRVENGARLREAAGLQHQALEWRQFAARAPAQQTVQRVGEILPHGAADTAVGQCHDFLVRHFQQQMIEADGTELVDDDRGVRQARAGEHARQQRGLAAAEEAGENRDRQRGRRQWWRGTLHDRVNPTT